ncbi:hypothetical protein Q4S57_26925 [Priestia megaterium]|uniref:hypothetical protein n=1 Tax=Priestia megaterium TaxID=1404 RepID=UPI0026E169D5|nr:hypothetical protein [Priestia megaterium]MDO6851486.1 hypothetical protein [Priestia megaterium]
MGVWNFQGGSIWSEKGFIPNKSKDIIATNNDDRGIYLSKSNLSVTSLGVF